MLIDSFLDYLRYERCYSEKTISAYAIDLNQFKEFVQEEVGGFDPSAVSSSLIREWVVMLMDLGYTSTSVNRKLSSLRSFYRFLMKNREILVDPLTKITGPKNKKTLPAFLKESEMEQLLDYTDFGEGFKASRDHLIIEMFYSTGIRLSELIGLRDVDVDLLTCQLKVTGKRNRQRLIPFGEKLKKEIECYVDVRDKGTIRIDDAFFVRETGQKLYPDLVYKVVKRNLSKVVSLKKRSPHVLRHTFATAMLNNHAELLAVKELLGHQSLATTEIYTHTTFEELKKIYKQAHPRS